jgi:Domain of unknown function (DUF4276)
MTWFEVLVEGKADVPAVKAVFERRFGLTQDQDFFIRPHVGIGRLPSDPNKKNDSTQQPGLLNQLPSKLRAYSRWLPEEAVVLVLIDSEKKPCTQLLAELNNMLEKLTVRPPRVVFRLAIEETESWFIADPAAILKAFPKAKVAPLKKIKPDAVVGAWQQLAKVIGSTGSSGTDKKRWAEKICPHLNLDNPTSPSLQKLISGIARELQANKP